MVFVAIAFPFLLMLAMLLMERVEGPLQRDELGSQLENFLDTAHAEEVETYVTQGFAPALERYWRRRRKISRPG